MNYGNTLFWSIERDTSIQNSCSSCQANFKDIFLIDLALRVGLQILHFSEGSRSGLANLFRQKKNALQCLMYESSLYMIDIV